MEPRLYRLLAVAASLVALIALTSAYSRTAEFPLTPAPALAAH